jgi:hypothetical protein
MTDKRTEEIHRDFLIRLRQAQLRWPTAPLSEGNTTAVVAKLFYKLGRRDAAFGTDQTLEEIMETSDG